jgi:perosamine synthetase
VIPYADPFFPVGTGQVLESTFENGQVSGSGIALGEMESKISRLLNAQKVFAVTNGSAAISLAFQALGLSRNSRVIVPGWGFHVAANVAYAMGAQVDFRDVSESSWCMEMSELSDLVDTQQHTIVILIHTLGNTADLDAYEALRKNPNIRIIEDSAEAFMSAYKQRMLGTFFDIGTYSMHAAKTITTGEGGFITVNDEKLNDKIQLLRNHGMSPNRPYFHEFAGSNYRLSNLLASIALPQLDQIKDIVAVRHNIYNLYKKNLEEVPSLQFLRETDPLGFFPWGVCVRFSDVDETFVPRLRQSLSLQGIDTRPGFTSASQLPYFKEFSTSKSGLAVSNHLSKETILLPQFYRMTNDQVNEVTSSIVNFS